MNSIRTALLAATAMLFSAFGHAATPAAFTIAPLGSVLTVKSQVNGAQRAAQEVYTLTNTGKESSTLEIQVFNWKQTELGDPDLTPTDEFVLYPKTITLKPGQSRAVRVIRREARPIPGAQQYFRVQFREVPRKFDEAEGLQVAIVTRVLVPLVLQDAEFTGEAKLAPVQHPDALHLRNEGSALLKLSSVFCGDVQLAGLVYVMPGEFVKLPGAQCALKRVTVEREVLGQSVHDVATP